MEKKKELYNIGFMENVPDHFWYHIHTNQNVNEVIKNEEGLFEVEMTVKFVFKGDGIDNSVEVKA